ncbi:hypothetical protein SKAU_G00189900 [Synaphobranchus kaupii]|uniref:Uncharacterized protein n=1 Tax=Synaphobranchus kaupii TaxID=118154 RepID=A0A9Q1FDI4_SYNKA|nr:hypothetical protein SKAU_G00189900 [Synaphobranchus kaupii]
MIDREWADTHIPNYTVRPLQELLEEDLNAYAANGHAIPYDGVPSNFDTSDPLVLYEPAEANIALGQLSAGEGLLEINNTRRPYVKVPISNHSKHEITLPKRTPLGTIQHVVQVLETDAPEPQQADVALTETTAEGNDITSPSGPPTESWLPPVDISHLSPEQQHMVERVLYDDGIKQRDQLVPVSPEVLAFLSTIGIFTIVTILLFLYVSSKLSVESAGDLSCLDEYRNNKALQEAVAISQQLPAKMKWNP